MSESHDSRRPQPRVRSGSHRAPRNVLAAVLPSVLAVAAVAALVTSLAVWQSERDTVTRAAAATGTPATERGPGPEETEPAENTPAATTAAASTPPPTPTPEPAGPSPGETVDRRDPAREMTVVVLNQTTRRGLAAQVAAELRAKGWAVSGVGNFTGVVPATTVYYPPGGGEQALVLAEDLPVEPRTRPRFGNLSTSSLTVVVTNSYPG